MPFANEHACRVKEPGGFVRMRRRKGTGDQPDMIIGVRSDGNSEVQAYRFPISRFTESQARSFCSRHGGKNFEAATNESIEDEPMDDILMESDLIDLLHAPQAKNGVLSEARVDREAGIVRDMKLLGSVSENGRTYSSKALDDAVTLYEGAPFYLDHPRLSELRDRAGVRSIHDIAGKVMNVRRSGDSVRGDVELLDREPTRSLVLALAEQAPSLAGNSHRAKGPTRRQPDGKVIVEGLTKVWGIELVTEAATAKGLFESILQPEDETVDLTLEQLKAKRPDLVEQILSESKSAAQAKELQESNAALKKENDELKAKDVEREHRALVDRKLTEAKLPARLVTDTFREQLNSAEDEKAIDTLIADRKSLVSEVKTGPQLHQSTRHVQESREDGTKPVDESKLPEIGRQLGVA